jgi:hypothetical protein
LKFSHSGFGSCGVDVAINKKYAERKNAPSDVQDRPRLVDIDFAVARLDPKYEVLFG